MKLERYIEAIEAFQRGRTLAPNDNEMKVAYFEALEAAKESGQQAEGLNPALLHMMTKMQEQSWVSILRPHNREKKRKWENKEEKKMMH